MDGFPGRTIFVTSVKMMKCKKIHQKLEDINKIKDNCQAQSD